MASAAPPFVRTRPDLPHVGPADSDQLRHNRDKCS